MYIYLHHIMFKQAKAIVGKLDTLLTSFAVCNASRLFIRLYQHKILTVPP